MLLSATGTEAVADGGSVWFSGSFSYTVNANDAWSSIRPAGDSELTVDVDTRHEGSEFAGVVTGSTLLSSEHIDLQVTDGIPNSFDSDSISRFADVVNTITPPMSEELTPEELPPPEVDAAKNETGLADVTLIARREVFAEIGSRADNLDRNDQTDARPSALLADDISPAAILDATADAYKTVKPLAGSRGRLAAFDLAMREESAERPLEFETVERDENLSSSRVSTDEPRSSQPDSGTSAGVTSFERSLGQTTRERDPRIHDLALADIAEFQTLTTLGLGDTPNSRKQELDTTPPLQITPTALDPISTRAVYLDQKHAQPVASLATVIGAAYVLNGNRQSAREDSEHEQLPPRDKEKRPR